MTLTILHRVSLSPSSLAISFSLHGLLFSPQQSVSRRLHIKASLASGFEDFFHFYFLFAMGKRMARTLRGTIGLVPATTQRGECVWLLQGDDENIA